MPDAPASPHTITIRRSLLRSLTALLVLLTGGILLTTVLTARRVRDATAETLVRGALETTEIQIRSFFGPVQRALGMTRRLARNGALDLEDPAALDAFFVPLLRELPQISSAVLGDERGRGYTLLRLDDRWRRRLVSLDRDDTHRYREWRDDGTEPRSWTAEAPAGEARYDPRTRPWYRTAREAAARHEPDATLPEALYWTEPYAFFTTGEPGITAMVHVDDASGRRWIVAFDVLLRDLSEFTRTLRVADRGVAFVLDGGRRLIGLPGLPELAPAEARAAAMLQRPRDLSLPLIGDGIRAVAALRGDPPDVAVDRAPCHLELARQIDNAPRAAPRQQVGQPEQPVRTAHGDAALELTPAGWQPCSAHDSPRGSPV